MRKFQTSRAAQQAHKLDAMRREIASLAARLMAEDGLDDFALAKRKAARQLGAANTDALPSNQAVEEALLAYQALYQAEEQSARLRFMRTQALALMRLLQAFRPYLTGAVLTGSAGRYSSAEIDLYTDNSKDVEIFLLDHHLDFEHVDTGRDPQADTLYLRVNGPPHAEHGIPSFLLAVHHHTQERMRRRNPQSGQTAPRANIDAVAALLTGDTD